MVPSRKAISIISFFEGFEPEAYLDPVGIPTIGFGHTKNVTLGDVIDREEAFHLLYEDMGEATMAVEDLVEVPLTQEQFDALVSFTFNLGRGNLQSSTLLKKLNSGDYEGAANEFTRWVYAGKKKLPGLVKRRKVEKDLFNGNVTYA